MIIHKDIGLTIYNKQIALDLDSDLIGGFITAISQFRSEIKKVVYKDNIRIERNVYLGSNPEKSEKLPDPPF